MFNYNKIRNEVEDYLEGCSEDYDIPAIMNKLMDYTVEDGYYIHSIDNVYPDDFTEILIECKR